MIFQTRDFVQKDYNIGMYIQNKNKDGMTHMQKERKEAKEKREKGIKEMKNAKTLTVEDKIKFLNLREFDYQSFVDQNQAFKAAQIEYQEMDHDILLALEQERLDEFKRQKDQKEEQKQPVANPVQ